MKAKASIILFGIITFISVIFVGGRVPYFGLYFFLGTILLPAIHGLFGRWKLHGEIILPEKELMAGEETKLRYIFKNNLPVTFPRLEFENNLVYRLTGIKEKNKIFHLAQHEDFSGESVIICRRRGHYRLGEAKLYIKDIFGLFTFSKKIEAPISLKVYPRIIPLRSFLIPASQQMGELIANEIVFQDYTSISDLKEYQEGDSVKKIHWKASSRQDNLVVKNFELRGDTEVLILLNNNQGDYKGDTEGWIEDVGVEVAISVVDYCLERNMQVSLAINKNNEHSLIKGSSKAYLKVFLESMVEFDALGTMGFISQIEKVSSAARQGTTMLIITPVLTKAIGTMGIGLKMKNINPIFILTGDEEINPDVWQQNKEVGKKLEAEGISLYMINSSQHIRDALEGKYEKGA